MDEEITYLNDPLTGQDPASQENPDSQQSNFAKEFIIKLSGVGKALADTYSEENQNTGEGFLEALKLLQDMRVELLNIPETELTIAQRNSFGELLKYLEGKINRRLNAVGKNDMNL